jgi:hypothetical protein
MQISVSRGVLLRVSLSFVMLIAFFLPWFQMAGFGVSGYNFGQLGSYGNLAWILPLSAFVTILVSFAGNENVGRAAAAFTGMVPFFLVYAALMVTGAPFQLLSIGLFGIPRGRWDAGLCNF